jgi:hypothetical protein
MELHMPEVHGQATLLRFKVVAGIIIRTAMFAMTRVFGFILGINQQIAGPYKLNTMSCLISLIR